MTPTDSKWQYLGVLSAALATLPLATFAIAMAFTGEVLTPGSGLAKFFDVLHVIFYAGRFTGPLAEILGILCVRKGASELGVIGIIFGLLSAIAPWQS